VVGILGLDASVCRKYWSCWVGYGSIGLVGFVIVALVLPRLVVGSIGLGCGIHLLNEGWYLSNCRKHD